MEKPLITVYITNYNYERFIKQSIESVLNQTYQNFELYIIDDGSTDGSRNIIETYRSYKKISIIYQKNKGLNITNNVAMRAANGKYLMRLDADDFLEPNALKEMSDVLESDEDLGLIFPDYYYVNEEGVRIGEEKRHNFEKEVSLYDQPAHGACTLVRLSFLKDLGGYNESFTCQDGYDLWIKFIMHHKVSNISKSLFSYRRHGNNLTLNEEKILNTRKKIKEIFVDSHLKVKRTLCIIPVRNRFIGKVNWPLFSINGKTILDQNIEKCLESKKIGTVVITSSEKEIIDYLNTIYSNHQNILILERPKEYSDINESLALTVEHCLKESEKRLGEFECIMTIALEFPFLNSDLLDDAINTLVLFDSDSVLSVRPDNRMYYQHTGHSLVPILDQDKFTKLEREALYKGVGGVVLSTKENFIKNRKLVSGKISHIIVDEKSAFGVFSKFEFDLFSRFLNVQN